MSSQPGNNIVPRVKRYTPAGFVLVEVLLSMTILAIAGTSILRTIQMSIEAAKKAQDTAQVVFLANVKLHELEMEYYQKPLKQLGQSEGRFDQDGAKGFRWYSKVDYVGRMDAYVITVWVKKDDNERHTAYYDRRVSFQNNPGFMLRSMVPTARFNDLLTQGFEPGFRGERGRR